MPYPFLKLSSLQMQCLFTRPCASYYLCCHCTKVSYYLRCHCTKDSYYLRCHCTKERLELHSSCCRRSSWASPPCCSSTSCSGRPPWCVAYVCVSNEFSHTVHVCSFMWIHSCGTTQWRRPAELTPSHHPDNKQHVCKFWGTPFVFFATSLTAVFHITAHTMQQLVTV